MFEVYKRGNTDQIVFIFLNAVEMYIIISFRFISNFVYNPSLIYYIEFFCINTIHSKLKFDSF